MANICIYSSIVSGNILDIDISYQAFTDNEKNGHRAKAKERHLQTQYISLANFPENLRSVVLYLFDIVKKEEREYKSLELFQKFTNGTLQLAHDLELIRD